MFGRGVAVQQLYVWDRATPRTYRPEKTLLPYSSLITRPDQDQQDQDPTISPKLMFVEKIDGC